MTEKLYFNNFDLILLNFSIAWDKSNEIWNTKQAMLWIMNSKGFVYDTMDLNEYACMWNTGCEYYWFKIRVFCNINFKKCGFQKSITQLDKFVNLTNHSYSWQI